MVLGRRTCQGTGHGIRRRELELVSRDYRTRLHHHRNLDVDRWRRTVHRTTKLLSPSTRQHPSILSLTLQTKDHHRTYSLLELSLLPISLTHHLHSGSSSSS